jgi:multiple sugar transport system permease protein
MASPAPVPPPRRGRLSQRRREELTAWLFLAPWLVGFAVFSVGAIGYSFWMSLLDTDLLATSEWVGLGNYRELLADDRFWHALRVTAVYTALTVPGGTLLALGIALLLDRKIPLRDFWRTVYYLPAVVSGVALAVVWAWVLHPNGPVNAVLRGAGLPAPRWFGSEEWALPGLVLVSLWGMGSSMVLYLAGLQAIPPDLQEAARVDGAGRWRVFLNVTLPLLTPTVLFNVVMNLIGSFQVFTIAYVITDGGPNDATLTLVFYLYRQAFQLFRFGYASAIAWVLFAIILVFTLALVRSSRFWVHYEAGVRE